MVSKSFSYAIKNNFADLFSSLTDFQIQLLSERCINEWMRKGKTPRINCSVSYLYLSSKNIYSFTNGIFNFIFLAVTCHRKEIILSETNESIYIITEYA